MKALSAALVLVVLFFLVTSAPTAFTQQASVKYMAFCVDGDGYLNDWSSTRYEAFVAGREHERSTSRSHRWEIWAQDTSTEWREPSCAIVSDGFRPETVRLQNACGRCVKFQVSRTDPDGSVKSKEISIKPNGARHFRLLSDARFSVVAESDCQE